MDGRLIGAGGLGLVAALGLGWWLLGDSGEQVDDVVRERPAVEALRQRGAAKPSGDAARREEVVAEARRTLDKVREASSRAGAAPAGFDAEQADEVPDEEAEPEIFPMDREGVRAAVTSASKEIRQCYDTLLQSYPDTAGRIDVRFEIEGQGDRSIVTGVEVTDETMNSRYMTGCVLTAMEDIQFEGTEVGEIGSVSWPFVFRNGQ